MSSTIAIRRIAYLLAVAILVAGCGSSRKSAQDPATPPTTASVPTTTLATSTAAKPDHRTPSEKRAANLILKLLKKPPASSLPGPLIGSSTQAAPLSPGSRKHHAAGAIVTTNGGALVGYLVFQRRADALADLKAFPPNSGPNKIVARNLPGFPRPSYLLRATGNGYVVRNVVFVDGPVIMNTWAYGKPGKAHERPLEKVVLGDARWGLARLRNASAPPR